MDRQRACYSYSALTHCADAVKATNWTVRRMAYSDAQREATERYNRKTYERIELKVKKGQKDYIQKAAASVGKSVNRFILDLVAKETGNDEI